jgi:hypothetical protein
MLMFMTVNVSALDILSGSDIIFSPSLLQLPSYYTFQVRNFTDLTSAIAEDKFCNERATCLATISVSTKEARLVISDMLLATFHNLPCVSWTQVDAKHCLYTGYRYKLSSTLYVKYIFRSMSQI